MTTLPEIRSSNPDLTAVVLAGGMGTRLRPVVSQRPKVLADVNGRPFLAYLLDQLDAQGIQNVVLCTGYMADQVQQTIGTFHGRIRIAYSMENTPLGTAGAVRLALPLITSEEILMLNGDSFVKADFRLFIERFRQKKARAALLLAEVPDAKRYGQVAVDENERILRFEEKGSCGGKCYINAGVYALKREIFSALPTDTPLSIEKEVFPGLIGHGFYAFKTPSEFLDIGIPEDYAKAASFLAGVSP